MPRVKRGTKRRDYRHKTLARASGYFLTKSKLNRAAQEAVEKSRPLFLDFGTENCHWCKQLELRTFADPEVRALLNERFIPLKIDAQRNAELAEKLNIKNYPTMVFAAAALRNSVSVIFSRKLKLGSVSL